MKTIHQKQIIEIFSRDKKQKEIPPQKVIVDHRENKSTVPEELKRLGLEIEFKELKVGDYKVRNTIIERKTQQDFLSSMVNKRLLRQIQDLSKLDKKLIIIEGQEDFSKVNEAINPNARIHLFFHDFPFLPGTSALSSFLPQNRMLRQTIYCGSK